MSDCIADMLTEVGGWGIPVCLGGEATGETATEGGFHFEQINDAPTNITSNVSSQSSAEQIGAQFNDNSAQDNETPEPQEQVNEESIVEKNDEEILRIWCEVVPQAWAEFKEPKVVSQTVQEEAVRIDSQKTDSQEQVAQDQAPQKGFFNKLVIGGVVVVMAAVLGAVAYIKKQ